MPRVMQIIGSPCRTAFLVVLGLAATASAEPAAHRVAMGQPEKVPAAGVKLEPAALAKWIDWNIQQQLDAEKVPASAPADDAEFLRRVYLDIIGSVPSREKASAFLDSTDPDKRAKLIDELLASPQYGKHMADLWHRLLVEKTSDNRRIKLEPLVSWLEKSFNENRPWDQMVTDIVTASGPQDQNGATTFFLGNLTIDKVNDTVARAFLGIQLQCAQCHNHPFTSWKQTEYWGMAGFFTKVQLGGNANKALKGGAVPVVSEATSSSERGRGKGGKGGKGLKVPPESFKKVPVKFLGGDEPKIANSEPYRPVLAKWLTSAENPYFARALANRLWAQYFGRGIVNPIDDMHDGNTPSHPEMLKGLAGQFTANGFDVKYLIRAICNSQTYQRTSKPYASNSEDDKLFSHMAVKSMSPEQLYDSLETILGRTSEGRGGRRGAGAQRGAPTQREAFLAFFRTDDGDPTEYTGGIPQALRLMNSAQMNNVNKMLGEVSKATLTPAQIIEQLYLTTLSRRPNADESARLVQHVSKSGNDRQAYSDILWALLNSSEFTLNH